MSTKMKVTKAIGAGVRLAAAVTVAVTAVGSCEFDQRNAALDDARQQWADAAIDDYRWTVDKSCFCIGLPGPVEITVDNGVATGTSAPVYDNFPKTVDDLFEIIEDNLNADDLQVRYHPELGYPEEVSVDVIAEAADDEFFYTSSNFQR